MRHTVTTTATIAVMAAMAGLSACKPPPTDADLSRKMPVTEPTFASDPLPSPDVEGAMWAQSATEGRIIYGIPGQPAMVALDCVQQDDASKSSLGELRIARLSPADEGAGALLALVGNGHIGRLPVDATELGGRSIWQGASSAVDIVWEPLAGPRPVTLTVPGAGLVTLNPSALPTELIEECRA